MLAALLLSFAVIFVAEMGDKSQLMAMMFALRYRWWVVLGAIAAATTAVHVLSVAIGHYLGAALPTHLLGIIAGAAFVFFGLWTLRGDKLTDEDATRAQKATAPAFFVVTSALCWPNSATRRCSRRSPWRRTTTGWECGSAPRSEWSSRTDSPSSSGQSLASTFPSGSSSSPQPRCSCSSVPTCSSENIFPAASSPSSSAARLPSSWCSLPFCARCPSGYVQQ